MRPLNVPRRAHRAASHRSIRGPDKLTHERRADRRLRRRDSCDADRMTARADRQRAQFRDMLDEANRANASFYPIDPRGLAVFDTPIVQARRAGPPPPMVPPSVDMAMLRRASTRCERSPRHRRPRDRQLERSRRRPAARGRRSELVLSARLLLDRQARRDVPSDHRAREAARRAGARAARLSGGDARCGDRRGARRRPARRNRQTRL